MKTLAFKKESIEPILRGEKVVTLRARTPLLAGDRAAARCRRDQPPFAELEILEVLPVRVAELPSELVAGERVTQLYPGAEELVLVRFRAAGGPQFSHDRRDADQPVPGAEAGGDAGGPPGANRKGRRKDRLHPERVPGPGAPA